MRPGTWLEIPNSVEASTLATIQSHGFIEAYLIRETPFEAPSFPFILLVNNPQEIESSKWIQSEMCQGVLFRASEIPTCLPPLYNKKIFLEILVDKKTNLQAQLDKAQALNPENIFVTGLDSLSTRKLHKLIDPFSNKFSLVRPYDLPHTGFQDWYTHEVFPKPEWNFHQIKNPELSIIIPHYESPYFLMNVLRHLEMAFTASPHFEVLVIDDSSSEKTWNEIVSFSQRKLQVLPLQLFRWPSRQNFPAGDKVFRAGASRNWGATYARGENLFFLDSDMLVPQNIFELVTQNLKNYDVIQFVRQHVPTEMSSAVSLYSDLLPSPNLYIEEKGYWEPFFNSREWEDIQDYWKYTCTYALAIKRSAFFEVGRLRRNFIQYGFEDTDLGYRLYQHSKKFHLEKTPLLHLTSQKDSSQNFLYKIQKMKRIQKMAHVFYKLNLDPEIFEKFRSFFT